MFRAILCIRRPFQRRGTVQIHRQAQSRVTELYLRNLDRRLLQLKEESKKFRPYSSDPSAPMVEPKLIREIQETESTIARHQKNLEKYQQDEADIIQRFDGDIHRFRDLKGLPMATAQALPE